MLSLRSYFFRDRFIIAMGALTLVALAWTFAFVLAIPKPSPEDPFVILHYTIYFGIQGIGEWSRLLWYPIGGTIVFVVHTLLAYSTYDRAIFWSYVFMVMGAVSALFLFMGTLFLLTLNI